MLEHCHMMSPMHWRYFSVMTVGQGVTHNASCFRSGTFPTSRLDSHKEPPAKVRVLPPPLETCRPYRGSFKICEYRHDVIWDIILKGVHARRRPLKTKSKTGSSLWYYTFLPSSSTDHIEEVSATAQNVSHFLKNRHFWARTAAPVSSEIHILLKSTETNSCLLA